MHYQSCRPGKEVRLRWAYFVTCNNVVRDSNGQIIEIQCTYDPATKGGDAPDGRKVKATLHWVSAADAVARCRRASAAATCRRWRHQRSSRRCRAGPRHRQSAQSAAAAARADGADSLVRARAAVAVAAAQAAAR